MLAALSQTYMIASRMDAFVPSSTPSRRTPPAPGITARVRRWLADQETQAQIAALPQYLRRDAGLPEPIDDPAFRIHL